MVPGAPRLRHAAHGCALVALLVAGATALGWLLGSDTLTRGHGSFQAMVPNTAMAIAALAGAIILRHTRPRLSSGAAAAVAVLAALTLIEWVVGVDLGIDTVFGSRGGGAEHPGRTAGYTALALLMVSVATLTPTRPGSWSDRAGTAATAVAGLTVLTALIGLLVGEETFRGMGGETGVALGSLVALTALTVAAACLRPHVPPGQWYVGTGTAETAVRRVMPIALASPVALAAVLGAGVELELWGERMAMVLAVVGAFLLGQTIFLRGVAAIRDHEQLRDEFEREARVVADRLRESEQRYGAVVDALHEGVLLQAPDGTYIAANPRAAELLGVSPAELRGRTSLDPRWGTLRPDGRPMPEDEIPSVRALATGEPQTDRVIGIHIGDDQIRWLLVNATPLWNEGAVSGVVASFADITMLRERERALAEAEHRFRTLFDGAPIGMSMTDFDGRIVMANAAWARLVGKELGDLPGTSVDDLTHPEDRADGHEALARLRSGARDATRLEQRYVHADGNPIWAQIDIAVVRDADGSPRWAISQVQDISERRRHEQQLEHLADHDALTGLFNRRGFTRALEQQVSQIQRYGAEGALLMLDLDNFKYVNDTLGHKAGDDLIVEVAELLRDRLRGTDVIARLGGDEFAVILPRGTLVDAAAVAESIVELLRHHDFGFDGHVRVTASIGVVAFEPEADPEDLLVSGDLAMYDAKEAGRDRVAIHADETHEHPRMEARLTWLRRIRNALAHDGLRLMAQPIVRTDGSEPVMNELLVRLVGDDGDLIPPASFLPVAERFDVIQEIDRWVVTQACELLGAARRAGRPLDFTVNVSGKSLAGPAYCDHLTRELARTGAEPGSLILEITETSAVAQVHYARTFAERVRDLGCRLAIDDFGAGFGSFYYLKHLPFDFLKIDGQFVTNAPNHATDQLIVEAVRDLAHGMGREVIAEFCIDAEVQSWLADRQVDMVQGYHIGRPCPIDEMFADLVEDFAPARTRRDG